MNTIRLGERDLLPGYRSRGVTKQIAAVDGMARLISGSIGAIITDPPFHVGFGRNEGPTGGQGVDPWTRDEVTDMDDIVRWTQPVAAQVARVLRPGGSMVTLGSSQSLAAWDLTMPKYGCRWMASMTVLWNTGKPRNRNFGGLVTDVRWYVKQGARHTFNAGDRRSIYSNVLVCDKVAGSKRDHPSQKPVELTNVFVSLMTQQDDIVLDPFCGSGSTLVSAAMCGRQWMGFDTDEQWVKLANRRAMHWMIEEGDLRPIYLWLNGKLYEIED